MAVKVAGPRVERRRGRARIAAARPANRTEVPTVSDGKGSVARNAAGVMPARLCGAIIAGFDVH